MSHRLRVSSHAAVHLALYGPYRFSNTGSCCSNSPKRLLHRLLEDINRHLASTRLCELLLLA